MGHRGAAILTAAALTSAAVALIAQPATGASAANSVVAVASDPSGGGWTVTAGGAVTAFGGAPTFGDPSGDALARPVVGMAATPDGHGYWLVASDGGIFSYGDANFYGSTGAIHLNRPVVGMAATPDGHGYWLVASDGGIFSYGDADFYGSGAGTGQAFAGISPTAEGGYRLVAGSGAVTMFGPAPTVAQGAGSAGPGVRAAQHGPGPEITVSWSYPSGDPSAEALIGLYQRVGSTWEPVTSGLCAAACTTTTFYYLQQGATYEATVSEMYPGSPRTTAVSPAVTLRDPCPGQVCVAVDANRPIGPADHAAQGLLHAALPGADQTYLSALNVSMYRESVPYGADGRLDWSHWPTAPAPGARTTLLVSDAWWSANGGNPPAPTAAELPTYAAWLASYVHDVLASGHTVDYWEPFNEPGLNYYSPSVTPTVSAEEMYNLFLVSYQVIKSADPAARIIGPSMAAFIPAAGNPLENGFNMADFLSFASAHDLALAAVNWHYDGTDPLFLADSVAQARQMIAAHPDLGQPQLFLNEYGSRDTQRDPGWDVGYLTAVTDNGITYAGRSCWAADCQQPDLDGLLSPDGTQPLPDYFVRRYYGSMTGSMVATASSSDGVTSVASYDPGRSSVRVLLGRGVGYTDTSRLEPGDPGPVAPTPVTVRLSLPWSSGTVSLAETDISGQVIAPYQPAAPAHVGPVPVTATGPDTGTVTFTIPAFADGDAWTVTVTRS